MAKHPTRGRSLRQKNRLLSKRRTYFERKKIRDSHEVEAYERGSQVRINEFYNEKHLKREDGRHFDPEFLRYFFKITLLF